MLQKNKTRTIKPHKISVAQYKNSTLAHEILDVGGAVFLHLHVCHPEHVASNVVKSGKPQPTGGAGCFYRPELKETCLPPTLLCPEPKHTEPA